MLFCKNVIEKSLINWRWFKLTHVFQIHPVYVDLLTSFHIT
jgi:hypothetical protein